MDDRHIIRLLFERAESAIKVLSDTFGKRLHATAMNILGDPQDAEECVNDTYLAIWNTIPPQQPDPLCAYIYRVGRNTALKRLRSNSAQKRNSIYDLSLEELAGYLPGGSLEDALDARELGRGINAFLHTQTTQNRTVFLRRYWFGDSVKEIAAQLAISPGNVSVRLNRIRTALADYLTQEGFL